jgi:hypothetical protein
MPAQGRQRTDGDVTMATGGEAAPGPLEARTGAPHDELEGDVVEMAEDDR